VEGTSFHGAYSQKKGNSNKKRLAYKSPVRPILECRIACWDPCREGKINSLGRV